MKTSCKIILIALIFSMGSFLTAQQPTMYTLTINSNPAAGGSVTPSGTLTAPAGYTYTNAFHETPNTGYRFTGWTWTGGGSSSSNILPSLTTLAQNMTLTANFSNTYNVTVSAAPSSAGTISGGGAYAPGSTATITATPAAGYSFSGWTGSIVSMTNPLSITMNSDIALTATFSPSTDLWQKGNSNLFFNTGNIGIGTSSPGANLSFGNVNDGRNTPDGITWFSPAPLLYGIYRTSGEWANPNYQQLELRWQTGIIIDGGSAYAKSGTVLQPNGGNVGIGKTSPTYKLDVAGDINFTGNLLKNGQQLPAWTLSGSDISYSGGKVGIGNGNPTYKLDVAGDVNFTGNLLKNGQPLAAWTLSGSDISYSGGNVGIGTSSITSGYKFEVNGSAKIDSKLAVIGNVNSDMVDIVNNQPSLPTDYDLIWGTYGSTQNQPNNPGLLRLSGPGGATRFIVKNNGQVGIGIDPGSSTSVLTVNGKMDITEIEVKQIAAANINLNQANWADDVFSKNYKLMALPELEKYINANQHLPSVPTETEVKEKGVNVAEMNATLLRKVEELTKYVIDQEKRQTETIQKLSELQKENEQIKKELAHNKNGQK